MRLIKIGNTNGFKKGMISWNKGLPILSHVKRAILKANIIYGQKRKGAENELLDYMMSQNFGLNWKKFSYKRMVMMSHILTLENRKNNFSK